MTEVEWLAATDTRPMLEFLHGKASYRKLRLLAVASCHRISKLLPVVCKNLNNVLERYADGLVMNTEFQEAWNHSQVETLAADRDGRYTSTFARYSMGTSDPPTVQSVTSSMDCAATAVAISAENTPYDATHHTTYSQEMFEQVRLVQDIFGNTFRPLSLDPTWLTSTVLALATGIYNEKAFDRMPILADALQDAGCDDDEILNHCRQPGEHVRGCWCVDLLLQKS
jgi:hypothetical protein